MAPNPRIVRAFRSMKEIGISEEKVKPVLKKLLKLYDKNWELIESENYRVLADAIFDEEDSKVSEPKKDKKCNEADIEEEGTVPNELVRPLKRLKKVQYQEGLASFSHKNSTSSVAGTLLKKPKLEEDELPPTLQLQSIQCSVGNTRTEFLPASPGTVSPQPASRCPVSPHHGGRNTSPGTVSPQPTSPGPVSPHHSGRNKGKQTVEPRPLAILERSEPNSHSSQMHVSYKGKEPISPHVASNGKGPERVSLALRIKDPAPEPSILPKKRVPDTHALIIPKEEPFTDDMPQVEVPITVIHPDSLSGRDLPIGDFSTEKSNWQEPSESLYADEIVGSGASVSMNDRRTICELATVPDEIPSSEEIASSPLGEVKISLSYNSALGRPNFQFPSIDELRQLMEQRCLQSYKLIDPNFDVIKILNDMCECISELATNSSNQSQEGNVIPALDVLKKSPARDALEAESNKENGSLLARMLNGSFNVRCSANECVDNVGGKELVVVPQHQLTPYELRWLHDASDITKGEEKVEISWVNEINKDFPPPFQYISENLIFQNAHISFSLSRIGDESCCPTCFGDCLLSQQPCACACQAGGQFVYTSAGVVKEDFLDECISMTRDPQQQCLLNCAGCPLERSKKDDFPEPCKGHLKRKVIKECWSKCGCNKQCGNRVVQRGVNYKLQVFLTPDGRGWGLRTLEKLPKGAFVCEFVGEIVTISELYTRNIEKHACPVLLDAYWGLKGVSKDEEALCLDATCYGNVARFINHRCLDANLIEIPVEVETPDLHYYHLAFFTTREVEVLEELTWDYGIDFDDLDHPVKAFRCRCGSKFCRNMKRSTRSKSTIITR
ncbi:probable inactive histone-lysine N-methyltransferase SUVR2 isoform X2 [Durio zibethinus]|uniref:Probable inactive histone-lysine N-methyltransferase SUVR2 isoform X2 n=1 Tax=Durio zibethinus TaxID=66656 RepID=A0A6P6A153_DURZI|nr:probable inactive histone-lysine N-methyltransferase SUVR2 isoform X2 [Durio zibethinus]